ncbi:MAG: Trm112 family protein [Pseudomonadales bacterium]|nr:Trm112 family protein [Pseudomonadales bacterium]
MEAKLLEILVCPVTKASLVYHRETDELWCRASGLAYPIRDGIPVMLEEESRVLTDTERESLRG